MEILLISDHCKSVFQIQRMFSEDMNKFRSEFKTLCSNISFPFFLAFTHVWCYSRKNVFRSKKHIFDEECLIALLFNVCYPSGECS